MDNVVQNINMEDIISSNFNPTNEEQKKIDELAEIIKTFGLIDPIIVRPQNGKYEIVLGIDKYQASKLAGLNSIAAIIKEVDDETLSKYLKLDNQSITPKEVDNKVNEQKQQVVSNKDFTIPLENKKIKKEIPNDNWKTKNLTENSDIINLSELSKKEYERDDFKMNTEQLNSNMMNNIDQTQTMTQPAQGPTFGGRFFPSLEDEPTNMNMMGSGAPQPPLPEAPNTNDNVNLIDLTDLTLDKEQATPEMSASTIPNINNSASEINALVNNIQMPQNNIGINTPQTIPTPQPDDNVINLESLQNDNPVVQTIPEPIPMMAGVSDFGSPASMPQQFDMSQNIAPQMPIAPEFSQPMESIQMPQTDIGTSTIQPTPMPTAVIPEVSLQPNLEVPVAPVSMEILNNDFGSPAPMPTASAPTIEPLKDITPVKNTIKSLISNLEAFGYKININEEELPTSIKINIEVEK